MAETLRRSKRLSLKTPQQQTCSEDDTVAISSTVARSSPLKDKPSKNTTTDLYEDSLLLTTSDGESDGDEDVDVYTPREASTSSRTNSERPLKRKKRSKAPAFFQRMKDRQEKMKGLPFTSFPLDVVFEVFLYVYNSHNPS
jgi:hypothetical protein